MFERRSLIPALCLAGAVLLWGTSFPATKLAMPYFGPMGIVFVRMAFAVVLFVPFWRKMPRPDYRRGDWKWLLALGLFEPVLYFLFENNALQLTTASQAGVVSALVPLFVAVGARLFLSEELSLQTVAGLALSLGGVALLSFGGRAVETAPNPVLGNVLELLAMVCATGYMLVLRRLSSRYNPWILTGVMNAAGFLFYLPAAVTDGARWLSAPVSAWIGAAYLGAFVTLGAIGLYNFAAAKLPAARAAMSINLVPFVAVGASWLMLGEALTALQIVGGLVIVAGVFLGEWKPKGEEAEAEQPALEEELVFDEG